MNVMVFLSCKLIFFLTPKEFYVVKTESKYRTIQQNCTCFIRCVNVPLWIVAESEVHKSMERKKLALGNTIQFQLKLSSFKRKLSAAISQFWEKMFLEQNFLETLQVVLLVQILAVLYDYLIVL